jgi:hypothetical protein
VVVVAVVVTGVIIPVIVRRVAIAVIVAAIVVAVEVSLVAIAVAVTDISVAISVAAAGGDDKDSDRNCTGAEKRTPADPTVARYRPTRGQ